MDNKKDVLPDTLNLTTFKNVKSSRKIQNTVDWDSLVEFLTTMVEIDDRDTEGLLFNLTRYKTEKDTDVEYNENSFGKKYITKSISNVIDVGGLILDFDNEPPQNVNPDNIPLFNFDHQRISIQQAKEIFKDFEYVLYPSWSHNQVAYSWNGTGWDKVKTTIKPLERFRIVIPFNIPCPIGVYKRLEKSFTKLTHHKAAPESFRSTQIFYSPVWPKGLPITDTCYHNTGKFLDWSTLKLSDKPKPFTQKPIIHTGIVGGKGKILLDTLNLELFLQDQGLNPTGNGKWKTCICPKHSEHLAHYSVLNDNWIFSCKHTSHGQFKKQEFINHFGLDAFRPYCETEIPEDNTDSIKSFVSSFKKTVIKDDPLPDKTQPEVPPDIFDLLDIVEPTSCEPYTRDKRGQLIQKHCLRKKYDFMLLYAFEGFGKSYFAYLEAKKRRKILFASSSNEQSLKQGQEFRDKGLKVQIILSREYLLKNQYNINVTNYSASNPWESEKINEKDTKKTIKNDLNIDSDDEVDEFWKSLSPPEVDWSHDIICTTIARVGSWGKIQHQSKQFDVGFRKTVLPHSKRLIPKEGIVIFDDPDKKYFTTLHPYSEAWKNAKVDQSPITPITVNKRQYLKKPKKYELGFGIDSKIVFTTTELLTAGLIKRQFRTYDPKLMPDLQMIAGDITLIKTNMVRSKNDGLLPPIMSRLQREGFKFNYIADGQGVNHNLTNTKGQNELSDTDNIIEISLSHYKTVTHYLDELGWDETDRNTLNLIFALDDVQQAIGRNSGYRWSDKKDNDKKRSLVLCEPKLYKILLKYMRYYVNNTIDDIEKVTSLKKDYTTLEGGLFWYLRNVDRYLCQGVDNNVKAFKTDVNDCVKTVKRHRKKQLLTRVLYSLNQRYQKRLKNGGKQNKNWEKHIVDLSRDLGECEVKY